MRGSGWDLKVTSVSCRHETATAQKEEEMTDEDIEKEAVEAWEEHSRYCMTSADYQEGFKQGYLAGRRKGQDRRAYLTDEQRLALNTEFGYFKYADAQGQVSRKFADAVIDIANKETKC